MTGRCRTRTAQNPRAKPYHPANHPNGPVGDAVGTSAGPVAWCERIIDI